MSFIPAILVLLLVVGAATWMSRRWGRASEGRRPGHRHWITRSICALLGTAIVVALAVVTIRDARSPYGSSGGVTLQLPSQPSPELNFNNGPVRKGRFLLHVVLVSWAEGLVAPIHGRTHEIRWPQDADRSFHETFQSGGTKVTYQVSISEIRRYLLRNEMRMDVSGYRHLWVRSGTFSSNMSGGLQFPEANRFGYAGENARPFSVTRSPSDLDLLLLDLTPVNEDDPLRIGTFEEFLALRGEAAWVKQVNYERPTFWESSGSPAEELAKALQVNLFFLLVAAVLFAQLFRRRSLGFVKVAACLLLYVGALDRVALRIHESRLHDAAAPLEQRLLACTYLPSTTFFRKTALRDLESVAADPSAPEPLHLLATRLAERGRRIHFP